ncbi:class I SAM-dependent methyltransferase [Nitratireductor sp. ZSWI3]|uniref:class I SAM-dependent methyltransferase n=1 Tax=Nitratireductor sp. ZSWI3 TaxID=2966359 RepID=UPI00215036AA|nr:class I SAM-dependent methyltransferase [Nitratireductor sp. ZSWI3]MCR4265767.1 class I SAM-dependent methyltransferase [Nitratireductor sp. ZSWI3]
MTMLKDRIAALIAAAGPISVADYMALCLFDPAEGYYTTREPFGAKGDFTTAPEISQMFGELCAVWLYAAWQATGSPGRPLLAEIGPGRGTLMKDMLRTLARLAPAFLADARVFMIETSERLTSIQKTTLAKAEARPVWLSQVADLPEDGPLFIVGNELFDAVPIRQYVKTGSGWRERVVGLNEDGGLAFMAGAGAPEAALLPPDAATAAEGAIAEIAPARSALMEEIAARIAARNPAGGGAGLFIDYGYAIPATGDTLQALQGHAYADVLADPGRADLTAHVDFAALAAAARTKGLAAPVMEQGDFLLGLGLLERAGRLGANKSPAEQQAIRAAVERLAGPGAMGRLFKVLAVTPSTVTVPPFRPAH